MRGRKLGLHFAVWVLLVVLSVTSFNIQAFAADSTEEQLIDDMDNFSKMHQYTSGLRIVNSNPERYDDDLYRLQLGTAPAGASIEYNVPFPIGSFIVHTYRMNRDASTNEAATILKFYVSGNGTDYMEVLPVEVNIPKVTHLDDEEANRRVHYAFEMANISGNNTYLKIVFTTARNDWNPNINSVEIRKDTSPRLSDSTGGINYDSLPSLREQYQDYFNMGTAVEPRDLVNYSKLIKSQFGVLTTENHMKPHSIQPTEGNFYFTAVDKIVDFAEENGMKVRGHVLLYYKSMPDWFYTGPDGAVVSRELLLARLETHIKTIVGHYKGRIYAYDVVNELFEDSGEFRSYDRTYQILGEDYLPLIFQWAHEADPEAILLYNDNEYEIPAKQESIYKLVKGLLDQGVPIHGVGMQSHFWVDKPSVAAVEQSINRFADLGLKIFISEIDISAYQKGDKISIYPDTMKAELQELVAKRFGSLFDLYRRYKDVITEVNVWNVCDARTYLDIAVPGRKHYPLLFGYYGEPNPAFYRVLDFEGVLPRWDENTVLPERQMPEGYTKKTATAVKGTPVVDGVAESLWEATEAFDTPIFIEGSGGATAEVRALWDESNLYVLANVADSALSDINPALWFQDAVEIFVNENNSRDGTMQFDDRQIRISYTGVKSGRQTNLDSVVYEASIKPGGYLVEMKIPFVEIQGQEGMEIGFEAQVNDANESGYRTSVARWCDNTGDTSKNTSFWGTLRFVEGMAVYMTGEEQIYEGELYTLIYGLTAAQSVYAQDVAMSYDSQTFELMDAVPLAPHTVIADTYSAAPGAVRYKLATTGPGNALNGTLPVLELTFRAKTASPSGSTFAVASAILSNDEGHESAAAPVQKRVAVAGVLDQTALQEALLAAEGLYGGAVEGYADGQYILGAKAGLHIAIASAQAAMNNGSATQLEIDQAAYALNQAMALFRAKEITPFTGDLSGAGGAVDGRISIGDLGYVSARYGMTAADSGWQDAQRADIDGNGSIDLYDLTFVARRIN